MIGNKKDMKNGFTIMEILVAATIFSVAMGSISALFVVSLRGQSNAIAIQNLVNNLRFSMEQVSREARMAQRNNTALPACLVIPPENTFFVSGSSLTFIDSEGDCIVYGLVGGKIQSSISLAAPVDMTSDDILVNVLEFEVSGESSSDSRQPRVTIFIEAQDATQPTATALIIRLQTTISGRNIDTP